MEIRPRCHCFFLSKSKLGPMGPMGSSFKVFAMSRESTDVSRKLLCGLYKLVHPEKKKSPVWDHFHLVVTAKDNAFTGFVSCLNCKAVIRNGETSGTSTLIRHKCYSQLVEPVTTVFLKLTL